MDAGFPADPAPTSTANPGDPSTRPSPPLPSRDADPAGHAPNPPSLSDPLGEDAALRVVRERYEFLRELGRGGVGVAYHCRDRQLNRDVAVKLLRSAESATEDAKSRFRHEAQVAASLHHPHIVQLFDFGDAAGCPFMVMQLAPGRDLDEIVRESRLEPREAAEMTLQIADALTYAHERGLLHRDIKPKNIMIHRRPDVMTAMLLDFGLAKVHESALSLGVDSPVPNAGRLTRDNQILGTPVYMSPEQVRGAEDLDARSDLYSLGATLYEALAGGPPLDRATLPELLEAIILDDPAPITRVRPVVDADLATICHKCLQKEAENRYPSAAELAADLRRYLAGEPIVARPVNVAVRAWRRAKRTPLLSALFAALIFVVVGATATVAVRTIQRRADFIRFRADSRTAFANGDLSSAMMHAREAQVLEPADPEIKQLLAQIAAQEAYAFGEETFAEYRQVKARIQILQVELRSLRQGLRTARTHLEKRRLWEREEDLRRAIQEREAHFASSVSAFTEALGNWKDHIEARKRLADLNLDRFLDAERARDASAMDSYRSLVLKFGRQEYAHLLRGERKVRISFRLPHRPADLDAQPVEAYLFRYEAAGSPPIRTPVPANPANGEVLAPPAHSATDPVPLGSALRSPLGGTALRAVVDARFGSAFALHPVPAGRLELELEEPDADGRRHVLFRGTLPRGSYLLYFAPGQGLWPLRYPFEVRRDEPWNDACDIPGSTEVPPLPPGSDPPPLSLPRGGLSASYWRHVSAGPCQIAGDPEAQYSPSREGGWVRLPPPDGKPGASAGQGFYLARFEVTSGMYVEYLNDRAWHSPAAARSRLPRLSANADPASTLWSIDPQEQVIFRDPEWRPDWPVWGISWHDAVDYTRWLTRKIGSGWIFQLPTEDEWEKGARGPDGRFFPWGDHFDESFCRMQDSREGESLRLGAEPYGLFPVDESPYGVRDLAGGVAEWTISTGGPAGEWRVLKGASWSSAASRCRAASREARLPEETHGHPGFRLKATRSP